MFLFENTEIAFKYKSSNDLSRSYFIFKYLLSGYISIVGRKIIKFFLLLNVPIKWFIKPLIFRQFCGGESISECEFIVKKLAEYNVKSILDYSIEAKSKISEIDETFKETLKTIELSSKNENISFAVFKPSAFASIECLEAISDGKISTEINQQFQNFVNKVEQLCNTACQLNVRLLIDAEDFSFQSAVDSVVLEMMKKYNKEKVVVFNTLQMYRHDRLEYLNKLIEKAITDKFHLGIKLVRGAYMERERERANKYCYPSPICSSKNETDISFNNAVEICVKNLNIINLFCGTHNEESCMKLLNLMADNNIAPNNNKIFFSQLYGMSDNISFNLASQGYNVAKYIPYGPVNEVIPYLLRRAEENTSIKGQQGRELQLVTKEIKRRKAHKII